MLILKSGACSKSSKVTRSATLSVLASLHSARFEWQHIKSDICELLNALNAPSMRHLELTQRIVVPGGGDESMLVPTIAAVCLSRSLNRALASAEKGFVCPAVLALGT